MGVFLALCSALVYGVADYCGGHASRRWPSTAVTFVAQAVGALGVLLVLPILGDPPPPAPDWAWGAAAGLSGVVGLVAFYRGLADGAMTVVAPITAVVSAAVPAVVGLSTGERPGVVATAGVVVAVLAVLLVSGFGGSRSLGHPTTARVIALALVGGVGFGGVFVALDRTAESSGLWPVVSMRLVSIPIAFALAWRVRNVWRGRPDRSVLNLVVMAGLLDMSANVLFLLATRRGLLTVVGVIAALYPASTIALAFVRDGERVTRSQVTGLVLAGAAVVMVVGG